MKKYNMIIEDQVFERLHILTTTRHEACQFRNCNFERQYFTNYKFIDCYFENCNLSLLEAEGIMLQDCQFENCKIVGFQFSKATSFNISFSFNNCILDHSSFYGLNINKTIFKDCSIKEVDFENTDLRLSIFDNCNLERTIFHNTNLQQADFRTAYNYILDPDANKIKAAKFSKEGLAGLLVKHQIKISP